MIIRHIDLNAVYKKKKTVTERDLGAETIIVPPIGQASKESLFLLSKSTARFIWGMIDGKVSYGEIVGSIVENFLVTREKAEDDVRNFLARLEDLNLIERI